MSANNDIAISNILSLTLPDRSWQRWLSSAISVALLVTIIYQLNVLGLTRLRGTIPSSPIFWLAFSAYYLALPASEWIIFRKLWRLPGTGFAALLRKLVSNEVLFGYSGELGFYAWARRRSGLSNAPFGAIKDVSITSAVAGNLVTLVMVAAAWPLLAPLHHAIGLRNLALSAGAILFVSLLAGFLQRRIFSLPGRTLCFILGIHLLRLTATTLLSAVMWHSALGDVPLTFWVMLAALQLLVTRLPFIPNKDLVFAGATLFLLGHDVRIGMLITLIATFILLTHLMIGGMLAIADLFDTSGDR